MLSTSGLEKPTWHGVCVSTGLLWVATGVFQPEEGLGWAPGLLRGSQVSGMSTFNRRVSGLPPTFELELASNFAQSNYQLPLTLTMELGQALQAPNQVPVCLHLLPMTPG